MHSPAGARAGKFDIFGDRSYAPNRSGVFEAKARGRSLETGKSVPKSNNKGQSSFFPESWNRQRTLEEVAFAYRSVLEKPLESFIEGNEFRGRSFDKSIKIHFYLKVLKAESSFPKI